MNISISKNVKKSSSFSFHELQKGILYSTIHNRVVVINNSNLYILSQGSNGYVVSCTLDECKINGWHDLEYQVFTDKLILEN